MRSPARRGGISAALDLTLERFDRPRESAARGRAVAAGLQVGVRPARRARIRAQRDCGNAWAVRSAIRNRNCTRRACGSAICCRKRCAQRPARNAEPRVAGRGPRIENGHDGMQRISETAGSWMEGERSPTLERTSRLCGVPRWSQTWTRSSRARTVLAQRRSRAARARVGFAARAARAGRADSRGRCRAARRAAWKRARWFAEIFDALPRPALAGAYLAALIGVSICALGPSTRQLGRQPAG